MQNTNDEGSFSTNMVGHWPTKRAFGHEALAPLAHLVMMVFAYVGRSMNIVGLLRGQEVRTQSPTTLDHKSPRRRPLVWLAEGKGWISSR